MPGLYPDVLSRVLSYDEYGGDVGERVQARRASPAATTGRRHSAIAEVRDQRIRGLEAAEARLVSPLAGVPEREPRLVPLGLPVVVFDENSALTLESKISPAKPFQGYRLIVESVPSVAGSGGAITITTFAVGTDDVRASLSNVTIATYRADAVGTGVVMPVCPPGVDIIIRYTASAQPGVGETVAVATSISGLVIS